MDKDYTQLQQKVAELEKKLLALTQTSTIPAEIEKALMGRGFLNTSPLGTPDQDTWFNNEGFIVATTPEAQAPATQYLRIKNIDGQNYWIAVYTFSELGG
jgi:hypothetical protein